MASIVPGSVLLMQSPVRLRDGSADTGETGSTPDPRPGSRIVMFDPANAGGGVTSLTPEFESVGPPDVSFDGRRMLFVGRRGSDDPLHVWEKDIGSGKSRRITRATDPSVGYGRAIYLSTIYFMGADAPYYQIAFVDNGGALATCRMDGTGIRRITFNPQGAFSPFLLSDGRLLFGSRANGIAGHDTSATALASSLLTVNTDGTDVFAFAATHERPALRSMPCETQDDRVVYVEAESAGMMGGGSLVSVSRTRSLHSRTLIAHDRQGLYHSPSAMKDGRLLVSYRSTDGGTYGLYVLDPSSGKRIATVLDTSEWHETYGRLVGPRLEPPGRSSVVDDEAESGLLYCLDAYLSDLPNPLRTASMKANRIARVRVFEAVTKCSSGKKEAPGAPSAVSANERQSQRWLGEADVATDGSFFLQLPARTALRLETVDEAGNVHRSMQSWMWVMPNESRGCIGCHEDRELTPPNRHVLALKQTARPIGIAENPDGDRTSHDVTHRAPGGPK